MVTIELNFSSTFPGKINTIIRKLPGIIKKSGIDGTQEFARSLQNSIKRRAPQATGYLKRSISVYNTKNGAVIQILAPYAPLLEYGFTQHPVSIATVERSMSNPGYTMFKGWKKLGIPAREVYGRRPIISSPGQPFINPAIDATIKRLPLIMTRAIEKGVKELI